MGAMILAVSINAMRNTWQVIARKLLESKQTIPHYYLSIDCEMDALMR